MRVLPFPFRDPLAAFQPFAPDSWAALLDSAAQGAQGRYAYIAADPYAVIVADDSGVLAGGRRENDPFDTLATMLRRHPLHETGPVPFCGGAVGYLGYELGRHVEQLPPAAAAREAVPEMAIGLYDTIAAFDLDTRQAWVIATGLPETEPLARRRRADARAAAMLARIGSAPALLPPPAWTPAGAWQAEQGREAVEAAIARTIEYIRAGDIFQANITQRMRAARPAGLDDFMFYRRLRALSPAPFSAFLRCGPDLSVASASPERFLSLSPDGRIETRPIKGTRPRDPDPARDRALGEELAASAKDRAENLMIVDLMRNDIGRVCEVGSVRVPVLCGLETFASVHHLVSVVEGQLAAGRDAIDLLRAAFPGGSITGAPKVRAMEIIRELEPARRGVSFGSVVRIGFDGAMDSSIAIRTVTLAGDTLIAQAGGGITADSDPAAEYDEALVKLAPLLRALTGPAPDGS